MRLEDMTDADYEIGRQAVEAALIELRDGRISILGRGNGLVIREQDGSPSDVIRLGMEDAMRIAVKAIIEQRRGPKPVS